MNRRILIVEDSLALLEALSIVLEQWGYEVLPARDAETALDLIDWKPADMAILSVGLRGMSGIELCGILRDASKMPIIMFTGSAERAQIEEAMRRGADDYVLKASGTRELLARISVLGADDEQRREDRIRLAALPDRRHLPIIVADPNKDSRQRLLSVLDSVQHDAREIATGAELMDEVQVSPPKLLMLEPDMPDLKDFDLLDQLRDHTDLPMSGVQLITRTRSPEFHRRLAAYGLLGVVDKPWKESTINFQVIQAMGLAGVLRCGNRADASGSKGAGDREPTLVLPDGTPATKTAVRSPYAGRAYVTSFGGFARPGRRI